MLRYVVARQPAGTVFRHHRLTKKAAKALVASYLKLGFAVTVTREI